MAISRTGPLTKHEMKSVQEDIDRIIAKALRDNNVFMPLALEMMNYNIHLVDKCVLHFDAPAWTDYTSIYINVKSEFFQHCMNAGMSFINVMSTLLFHEVGHPLLFHDKRCKHRDPDIWNKAADFVINLLLANLEIESAKHVKNPLVDMQIRKVPFDKICLSDTFAGMIEEEVYNELLEKNITKTVYYMSLSDFNKAMGNEDGDDQDGQGGQGDDDKDQEDGDQDGQGGQPQVSEDPNDINGPAVRITEMEIELDGRTTKSTSIQFPEVKADSEEGEKQQKKRHRNLQMNRKMFENTLMKGVGSDELRAYLGKLFKVKIDFEKILKDSLLTALQKGQDQVWHKPRTIWLANPYMPYLPNVDDEEVRGIAFFAIDESGSMPAEDIKKAAAIVVAADEYYKTLVVIKHDYTVSKIYVYNDDDELTDDQINELCHRIRCGGTSHKDVFAKINEYLKEHPEEMASVFVGCTDLESDIQHCQNDLPSYVPRIWIVNSGTQINGLVGRVIRLK